MSNQLNFDFNSNQVRVINDDPNNPLFVAHDVATALGYEKPRNAITRFCKGALKQGGVQTNGGAQELTVIKEPDLYRLIFGSKLKSAIKFQDWVFNEVLPSIRKTGKYEKPKEEPPKLTIDQRGHIYQTVMSFCKNKGEFAYRAYFSRLKKHFRASSYKHILRTDYVAACHFLGIKPIKELIEQTEQTTIGQMQQGNVIDLFSGKSILIKNNKINEVTNDTLLIDMKSFSQKYLKVKKAMVDLEVFMDVMGFSSVE